MDKISGEFRALWDRMKITYDDFIRTTEPRHVRGVQALFTRLQQEGKLELDDRFFVSPMDFYTAKAPSYADAVSTRRLYWTMLWMFVNFYVISFTLRPWRMIRTLLRAVLTGTEESRYAKWFVDIFYTRRRCRKIAGEAAP